MAVVRIINLPEALSSSDSEYMAIDDSVNGTRKISVESFIAQSNKADKPDSPIAGHFALLDADGNLVTGPFSGTQYQTRGYVDLNGSLIGAGVSGKFFVGNGYKLRDLEPDIGEFNSVLPPGVDPWSVFDWDGDTETATNIIPLVPGDQLEDSSLGMVVEVFYSEPDISNILRRTKTPLTSPRVFNTTTAYLKGEVVYSTTPNSDYQAIHNIGGYAGFMTPETDPTNWVAYGTLASKADKVGAGHTDKVAAFDAAGNLVDSGESKLVLAQATTTQRGTSERATSAKVIAGTDDLAHVTSAGIAAVYAKKAGPAHIIPEVTSNNETNGANFLAAYSAAAALTPGGAPLSETNRACVLLLPGTYDWSALEGAFSPVDFVDIAGISGNRADVQLVGGWATSTTTYDVANLTGGDYSFGGGGGTFSGTATNCTGGYGSFGGGGGTFSGTATNCTGGYGSFGGFGTFSGTATDCTGGDYSFGGGYGTFSGTATDCTGGTGSFASYGGTFSGTAKDCTGGNNSFGGGGGTFSGTATGCTGGEGCFAGEGGFFFGTPRITGCVSDGSSFGASAGSPVDFSGAVSVLVKDCRLINDLFTNLDAKYKVRSCLNDDLSEANFN